MHMTEEEAKKKWCPMVRFVATNEPPANRWPEHMQGEKTYSKCLAADCMMWVWSDATYVENNFKKSGRCGMVNHD